MWCYNSVVHVVLQQCCVCGGDYLDKGVAVVLGVKQEGGIDRHVDAV